MRIRDGATEYVVHLTYLNDLGNRAVTARVHEGKCFEPWGAEQETCQRECGVGTAVCNPKDQYVRATGRKVALGRALRSLDLDWETRARIWSEYLRPSNVHALPFEKPFAKLATPDPPGCL